MWNSEWHRPQGPGLVACLTPRTPLHAGVPALPRGQRAPCTNAAGPGVLCRAACQGCLCRQSLTVQAAGPAALVTSLTEGAQLCVGGADTGSDWRTSPGPQQFRLMKSMRPSLEGTPFTALTAVLRPTGYVFLYRNRERGQASLWHHMDPTRLSTYGV